MVKFDSGHVGMVVALLAEGVDRNPRHTAGTIHNENVALLAEGVDRNCHDCDKTED